MTDNDGVWRTVGGRRIFIKNGQSLEEAMQKSGKFKLKKINEQKNNEEKYKGAKLKYKDGKAQIVLSNNEVIEQLSKKEYKKMSKDFAESLNDDELALIQSYVDMPGYSGELNAGENSGTKYMYNNTNTKYFENSNEMNKRYENIAKKYEQEVRPLKDINPYWPAEEDMSFASKFLKENASTSQKKELIKQISRRTRDKKSYAYDEKYLYHTPKEIAEFKEKAQQIKLLNNEQQKYDYNSEEYKKYDVEIQAIGGGKSDYYFEEIAKHASETEFNELDYDFNIEKQNENIKYITASDLKNMKLSDIDKDSQPSGVIKQKNNIDKFVKDYNKLFEDKGVELDKDIIVFRRGRDNGKENSVFIHEGLTSTSAFDNLPKKMPSGIYFGDERNYVIVPKGTKILFAEEAIGKLNKNPNEEDIKAYNGVKRQHEIILPIGSKFEYKIGGYTEDKKGKTDYFEYNNIVIMKKGGKNDK